MQQFALGMSAESGYTRPTEAVPAALGDGVRRVLDNAPDQAADVLSAMGCPL